MSIQETYKVLDGFVHLRAHTCCLTRQSSTILAARRLYSEAEHGWWRLGGELFDPTAEGERGRLPASAAALSLSRCAGFRAVTLGGDA